MLWLTRKAEKTLNSHCLHLSNESNKWWHSQSGSENNAGAKNNKKRLKSRRVFMFLSLSTWRRQFVKHTRELITCALFVIRRPWWNGKFSCCRNEHKHEQHINSFEEESRLACDRFSLIVLSTHNLWIALVYWLSLPESLFEWVEGTHQLNEAVYSQMSLASGKENLLQHPMRKSRSQMFVRSQLSSDCDKLKSDRDEPTLSHQHTFHKLRTELFLASAFVRRFSRDVSSEEIFRVQKFPSVSFGSRKVSDLKSKRKIAQNFSI